MWPCCKGLFSFKHFYDPFARNLGGGRGASWIVVFLVRNNPKESLKSHISLGGYLGSSSLDDTSLGLGGNGVGNIIYRGSTIQKMAYRFVPGDSFV